jgi:hypothetical protein
VKEFIRGGAIVVTDASDVLDSFEYC